jgi:hypothetical protein
LLLGKMRVGSRFRLLRPRWRGCLRGKEMNVYQSGCHGDDDEAARRKEDKSPTGI